MILIPFSTTTILAPLPLQTIFPVLIITFPLFLMSAEFPRTKKKSYHTAEGAICYIKQILICIIVAPISVLAKQQNQQSSIQKDIVCKAFCLTGEPSVGSIAISSIQGQGALAS